MPTPTYLVAKYVPDPVRMEPRNIGVVLWSRGGVASRFLPASEAAFVDDKRNYQRWTQFWSKACTDGKVRSPRAGVVPSTRKEFLDAMRDTQRGSFLLYEGGSLLENIKAADRKVAADYLYRELVSAADSPADDNAAESLKSRSDALFAEAGLAEREEFIDGYELELDAEGVGLPFKFDHAWAPGTLAALFQRVHLDLQQSTTNAAFLFEHAKTSAVAKSADRFAVVTGTGSASAQRKKMLRKYCDVLDLSDFPAATAKLRKLAR